MFHSRSIMILHLQFRSMIHFYLSFVKATRSLSRCIFLHMNVHLFQHHLLKRLIFAFYCFYSFQFSSVQFSRSVVSDSFRPHESQHTRPSYPSPTPGVYSNSCPWSQWCHPAISSSVVPFSSCPQSLAASGSFPKSQLFAWGGQSIGVSRICVSRY